MEKIEEVIKQKLINKDLRLNTDRQIGMLNFLVENELIKMFLNNKLTVEDIENYPRITYMIAGMFIIQTLKLTGRVSCEWGVYIQNKDLVRLRKSVNGLYKKITLPRKRYDEDNETIKANRCLALINNNKLIEFRKNRTLELAYSLGFTIFDIKIY